MNTVQPLGLLVGRVLLALIFIGSGFSKITGFADTAASMAGKGIPMVEVLLIIAILIELGGGLLLALGYKARWAALAICPLPDPGHPDLSRLLGGRPRASEDAAYPVPEKPGNYGRYALRCV